MTATLDVDELAPADEAAALDLLRTSLAGGPTGERTESFHRWKHKRNPAGPSYGLVAKDGDRVVGVRLFLRWRLRCGDRNLHAVRAVDTATHPDYQGRGIFRRLTLEALDRWADDIDLVFNTPNSQSRPGYLKMGWQPVGDVPISIRVVRPLRFARHASAAARRDPAGTDADASLRCRLTSAARVFDDVATLTDLLARAEIADPRLHTPRTLEFLKWRYADAPGLDYRVAEIRDGDRLLGVAFARPRRRGPLLELTLSDLIVRPGDHRTARRLLRACAHSGVDHVTTHVHRGHPAGSVARRAGYLTPPRLGMALVANPRRPLAVDPLRLDAWALALGDLEVF